MQFSVLFFSKKWCATITTFLSPQKEAPFSLAVTPMPLKPPSFLQSQATTNLLPVSKHLPILDTAYKWNHVICHLLWLVSFTYKVFKSLFILYPVSELHFFLLPENIPLYGHTTFGLSIHFMMDIGLFQLSAYFTL